MGWRTAQRSGDENSGICRRLAPGILISMLSIALAACSGPMNQSLVTNATQEAYKASLHPVFAKMTPHQQEAFNWAVSNFDLAKLNAEYPGGSPQDIIRGEVRAVLDTYPGRITALEAAAAKDAPLRDDLLRIKVSGAQFYIDKNFFGLQPKVKAVIDNHSSRPVSQLKWDAALFLDGATTPVARAILTSDFRRAGGLKPGGSFLSTFSIGFIGGDDRWTTLEIRNAHKTQVLLTPKPDSVLDFGDRPYLPADPAKQIEKLSGALKAAKLYSDI